LFYFDPTLRAQMRRELGYSPADVVLVYSGSLYDFQSFPECAAFVASLCEHDPTVRFLVVTPEADAARRILHGLRFGDASVLSAPLEGVNRLLNAADFGLLLRRDTPVNRVASPTKFSEYCLTGLPVVMTDVVQSAFEVATRLGNYVGFRFPSSVDPLRRRSDQERAGIASTAAELVSRRARMGAYERVYAATAVGE
jgi:hypothetical protein